LQCPKPLKQEEEDDGGMFVTDEKLKRKKVVAWKDQTTNVASEEERLCYICQERASILACECCAQPKSVCGACCLLRHTEGRWQPHNTSSNREPPDRGTEGAQYVADSIAASAELPSSVNRTSKEEEDSDDNPWKELSDSSPFLTTRERAYLEENDRIEAIRVQNNNCSNKYEHNRHWEYPLNEDRHAKLKARNEEENGPRPEPAKELYYDTQCKAQRDAKERRREERMDMVMEGPSRKERERNASWRSNHRWTKKASVVLSGHLVVGRRKNWS